MPKKRSGKRGPKAERLKLHGTLKSAAKKLLSAKRPPGGWPKAQRYAKRSGSEEE